MKAVGFFYFIIILVLIGSWNSCKKSQDSKNWYFSTTAMDENKIATQKTWHV